LASVTHSYRAFDARVHGAAVAGPDPEEGVGELHGDERAGDRSDQRALQQAVLLDEARQEADSGADHRAGCTQIRTVRLWIVSTVCSLRSENVWPRAPAPTTAATRERARPAASLVASESIVLYHARAARRPPETAGEEKL
jgi:hypothetical protein